MHEHRAVPRALASKGEIENESGEVAIAERSRGRRLNGRVNEIGSFSIHPQQTLRIASEQTLNT